MVGNTRDHTPGLPDFLTTSTRTCSPDALEDHLEAKEKQMANLYVGNLSFQLTDDGLQQLFTGKGYQVASARVICDRETGRSRGFGFVELGPGDDMARIIGEMNGLNVEGRALTVNEARPQESRRGRGYSGGRSGGNGRKR
jgi:RNA recognition motif-containing protein